MTIRLAPLALAAFLGAIFQVGPHTFHDRTLENGLRVLAVDDGSSDGTASVFVIYAVGNRMETSRNHGIAHLVEHTLYTGTAAVAVGEHDAIIKGMEGESNAFTRDDFTAYYDARVPLSELARVLGMEADRMRGLLYGEEDFRMERERLRAEEARSNRADLQVAARRRHALFGGVGYGARLLDDEGHTKGPWLDSAEARAFYDAWYHPRNATVVVVGPNPEEALQMVAAAFGGLPAGPPPPPFAPGEPALAEGEWEMPISRPRLEWVWPGPPLEDPDRLALLLLAKAHRGRLAADGSPVEISMGSRIGPDLFLLAATGEGAEDELAAAWAGLGSIDPLALEEAKRLLLASMHNKPLRGRPYFSLAVDVGVLAVWGLEGYASGFADALAALGPAEVAAAAARWLPMANLSRLSFTAGGGGLGSLPADAKGLAAAGEEAMASGDLPRAIAAYEALLQTGPNRMNTVIYRYYLGDMNFSLGRLEASREHLLAGLAVVDYPALGDLLREVEAAQGVEPLAEAEALPVEEPEDAVPRVPASGKSVIALAGVAAPAWAAEGTSVMAALEEWRQAPFLADLVVEFLEAEEDGPAGWYETDTQRLVVTLRGTERFGRGTMLHEMFHAHQDQRFGLGGLHRQAEALGPDAERALAALIEGEAMLAVQEIMAYDFSQHTGISETGPLDEGRFEKIFHYGVGLDFVEALRDQGGGWSAVDEAFRHPPTTTAEILDAARRLRGWHPVEVALPSGAAGASEGAYGVWLFLARPEGRRAAAREAAYALLGDSHTATATPAGERHLWRLEFAGEAPAMDWLGESLRAAGAGVGTAFAIYRLGGTVILGWTEPSP